MIIGISGKMGSGKDTVGSIVQYLTNKNGISGWKIVKFADALKDIVCILTGCTREQLEDSDFKNNLLAEEWIRYGKANGFYYHSDNNPSHKIMDNIQCSKEEYENECRINWQTAYKQHLTYRELLQYLGTDLLRNQLHENVWVNAVMSKYIPEYKFNDGTKASVENWHNTRLPNWIITDVRFPNEAKAIKDRGGIIIKVERNTILHYKYTDNDVKEKLSLMGYKDLSLFEELAINEGFEYSDSLGLWKHDEDVVKEHISERALDNAKFNYTIDNNGTIEELIEKVREILIKEKLV